MRWFTSRRSTYFSRTTNEFIFDKFPRKLNDLFGKFVLQSPINLKCCLMSGRYFFYPQIWVQSPHNASGYFSIYGEDNEYNEQFTARLVTGNTTEVYARTGYLGFLRRTESVMSNAQTPLISEATDVSSVGDLSIASNNSLESSGMLTALIGELQWLRFIKSDLLVVLGWGNWNKWVEYAGYLLVVCSKCARITRSLDCTLI